MMPRFYVFVWMLYDTHNSARSFSFRFAVLEFPFSGDRTPVMVVVVVFFFYLGMV
jgi:hypothetical protein